MKAAINYEIKIPLGNFSDSVYPINEVGAGSSEPEGMVFLWKKTVPRSRDCVDDAEKNLTFSVVSITIWQYSWNTSERVERLKGTSQLDQL